MLVQKRQRAPIAYKVGNQEHKNITPTRKVTCSAITPTTVNHNRLTSLPYHRIIRIKSSCANFAQAHNTPTFSAKHLSKGEVGEGCTNQIARKLPMPDCNWSQSTYMKLAIHIYAAKPSTTHSHTGSWACKRTRKIPQGNQRRVKWRDSSPRRARTVCTPKISVAKMGRKGETKNHFTL